MIHIYKLIWAAAEGFWGGLVITKDALVQYKCRLNSDILTRRRRNWEMGQRKKSICAFAIVKLSDAKKRKEMRSRKDHYNGFVTMCVGVGLDNYHIWFVLSILFQRHESRTHIYTLFEFQRSLQDSWKHWSHFEALVIIGQVNCWSENIS